MGDYNKLKINPILKAKAEPKCRFLQTLMHGKILTAENLQKKGWQNDPICKLCNNEQGIYAKIAPTQNEFGQSSACCGTYHHS